MKRERLLASALSLAMLGVLLIFWELSAQTLRNNFLFGSPSAIAAALWVNSINGNLPWHALITGGEAFLGFVSGSFAGMMLGFALWYSPLAARVSRPFIFVLGIVPVFAFAPLVIVWFGVGFEMKVALAAFGTALVSLSQAYEGARNVEHDELLLMQTLRATRLQVLRKIVFPSSLSWVFNSLRMNIGFALLGAFIGEFISAEQGIGYFMIRSGSLYDVPGVFAGGVYLVWLALVLHWIVLLLERRKLWIIGVLTVDRSVRTAVLDHLLVT